MPEGLYTGASESSFESFKDIRRKESSVLKEWDNPYEEITFTDRIEEAIKRQEWREKQDYIPECAEIRIETTVPIALCNLADPHMGALGTDYDRLRYVVDTIKYNDNAFCFLGGDFCQSMCWNPGQNEDILNFQEQYEMMYALLKELKGKIIGGVIGNHGWEERNGVSKWQEFLRNADAPLFHNLGFIELFITNPETEDEFLYNTLLGHQLKGYSYHNPNHPQGRFSKEVEGCDIIISEHTHTAGIQSVNKAMFGGIHKAQTFINGYPFKANDKFLRGKGNPNSAVGANWLYLSPHQKQHFAIPNTALACEVMGWEL